MSFLSMFCCAWQLQLQTITMPGAVLPKVKPAEKAYATSGKQHEHLPAVKEACGQLVVNCL